MITRIAEVLSVILLTVVLLIFGFILFLKIWSNHYMSKYEETELGTSVEAVKDNWGEPDNGFIHQDTLFILLYKDGVMTDYIFKFDIQNKKLVEKWAGD